MRRVSRDARVAIEDLEAADSGVVGGEGDRGATRLATTGTLTPTSRTSGVLTVAPV
jgi:hypothetical protein